MGHPNPDLLLSSYDYHLPPELIAKYPVTPRDSARLLVYNRQTGEITDAIFRDLLEFVPEGVHFIFNDTKVIKARLKGEKETGGKIELLLNRPLPDGKFQVYIRGRVKPGTRLIFGGGSLTGEVVELLPDGSRIVQFQNREGERLEFPTLLPYLEKLGEVPIPPYLQREAERIDELHYQTIFARREGAVASPTASLHFTPELMEKIPLKHFLTLHVGAGTFKPVEVENILEHQIHSEYYQIPGETAQIIDSSAPILAVGTTSTRSIEYYHRTKKRFGECDLFLHPLNPPQRVTHLLTNFHLPKSTLLMLVSAFVGREKCLELYRYAIDKKYRFYSYGDAMLIL
ncbi:MAG: tRNA preQ1(34) S-adenosylmethionine ribosyltransferase-isomerase QueA [Epsilonproteobacteria bacterium]|nr:tRNA preQ1(34) S-adenosylmethionine ribosyltransferase-isomerase QueA [Campylobacterota bacterium]NPA88780.1 tRNA preQ1(34) S-adenosylmethionine ribosyltransferase-isomerase QueA [Campylobacterota bacterium]